MGRGRISRAPPLHFQKVADGSVPHWHHNHSAISCLLWLYPSRKPPRHSRTVCAHPVGARLGVQYLLLHPGPKKPKDAAWAGAGGVHTPSAAAFMLQRLLDNPGSAASPLLLLQWDGAVRIPTGSPEGSEGSVGCKSGRMGATSERQLLSWPQNTPVPEDPRAQAHCSSRGRAQRGQALPGQCSQHYMGWGGQHPGPWEAAGWLQQWMGKLSFVMAEKMCDQRQGLPPSLAVQSFRETLTQNPATSPPHPRLDVADGAAGVQGGQACLQWQGHAALHGLRSLLHLSPDAPLLQNQLCVGPSARWAPTGVGSHPGSKMLTGSGAGSPSRGRSCTRLPPSPALSQSFADHSPPHPLPAPGGCPWCHKTGVPGKLPVSGSARAPAVLWPQRAAPGAVRSGIRSWM